MFWKRDDEARIAKLYGRGQDALDCGDTSKAHEIADKLAALRNTGAYEIRARAFWQEGKHDEAIDFLKVGVSKFPQVAMLCSYLGEFYSDSGRYPEALEAFKESSRGLGGCEWSADMNIALVHWRAGNYEQALETVDSVTSGPPKYRWQELRATILVDMGRFAEAKPLLDDLVESRPKMIDASDFGLMMGLMAQTELGLGNTAQALYCATTCIEVDKDQVRALTVLMPPRQPSP